LVFGEGYVQNSRRKLLPVLILLDAVLTVVAFVVFGAPEANPLCAWLLSVGVGVFGAVKVVVAVLAYVLLHARGKWVKVVLGAYIALVLWDLSVILSYLLGGR